MAIENRMTITPHTGSMTTVDRTWAPTDAVMDWDGLPMVDSSPEKMEEKQAVVPLSAEVRINKSTLAATPMSDLLPRIREKMLKNLFEQMLKSNCLEIQHDIGTTSGRVTFRGTMHVAVKTPTA